jgi:hypothetical protein
LKQTRPVIDASKVEPSLGVYGTLFKELVMASALKLPAGVAWDGEESASSEPIKVLETGETYVPFETVMEKVEQDAIYSSCNFGVGGYSYPNYFELCFVVSDEDLDFQVISTIISF